MIKQIYLKEKLKMFLVSLWDDRRHLLMHYEISHSVLC
jgi:hypothetical protein